MSIVKELKKIMREEYQNGATQDELAKRYNISQAQIARLLSNDKGFDKVYLITFDKMFPNAQISLSGEIGNQSPNAVIGNNFLPKNDDKNKNDTDLIQQQIKSIMLNTELSPDEKLKFIKILIGE